MTDKPAISRSQFRLEKDFDIRRCEACLLKNAEYHEAGRCGQKAM
jgi:hypothetical protein